MRFRPDEFPRTVFPREVSRKTVGAVVILQALVKIPSLSNVELAAGVFQYVDEEHLVED